MKKTVFLFSFLLFKVVLTAAGQERIYFLTSAVAPEPVSTQAYILDFQDEFANDTLFQNKSKEGFPVNYSRRLEASVCFDNKCRLLDVVIYWNITGRYLGFKLPGKEFLSKSDHEPFTEEEYLRLNQLLADQQSPLGVIAYEELVPKQNLSVDGVSSATAKNILDYIVQGAAYTTYKMWHFIYGPTQKQVVKQTEKILSPELIDLILQSPDPSDKIWALNHISGYVRLTPELQRTLLSLMDPKSYSYAERAIHAIGAGDLESELLQTALMEKFEQTDYSLRKLLIKKLKESPFVSEKVQTGLADNLKNLNGELTGDVLDLFKKFSVRDVAVGRQVAALLLNENTFISQKALKFLETMNFSDKGIDKQVLEYKNKLSK